MQQTLKLVVPGDPRGKGRPRFGNGRTYTDAETTKYEGRVREVWKSAGNLKFSDAPISVYIKAYFKVPTSLSKKKKAELFGEPCLKKPDADNIAKILLDALNGCAWTDDSQIDILVVTKQYVTSEDEPPRVEVEITGCTE